MPIVTPDPNRDELLSELGGVASSEYKELLKTQKELMDRLKREQTSKAQNKQYIRQLQQWLAEVNNVISEQNQAISEFYDEFMRRVGEGKDIDTQMLKDLIEYQNTHVRVVETYKRIWQTRRKEQEELNALYAEHLVDGKRGGQLKTGYTREEERAIQRAIQEKEEHLAQLEDNLLNLYNQKVEGQKKLQERWGNGSYVHNAARDFARDKEKQVAWLEKQAKLEQFCLDSERDYNEAVREGNRLQEKRNNLLKGLEKAWGGIWGYIKKSAEYWETYNHQAISDAKRLGITSRESAQAYNAALMESSKQLSRNFGLNRDQAMKIQEAYVKTIGRVSLLTQEQISDIAATSSIMGEQNVQAAIAEMDKMGGSAENTMELLGKNYAKAANSGLDIVKASETLVKNLALANQFSFRDGVNGLMRMSIESQRIKLNVAEVGKVANKFGSIEGAIQGAAQLQMLGGYGAMYGGNPMQMMYEALSDPEALYERMGKMFAQQARFDRKRGISIIDPLQLQIIKEQAKAMGMDENEAVQTAKQQAKIRAIDEDWRRGNLGLFNSANAEQRAAIENRAQYSKESGWTVTYIDQEGQKQTKAVNALTANDLLAIQKDNIEPVEDIRGEVRKIAQIMVSFKDRKRSLIDMFWTNNAQTMNPVMNYADDTLTRGAQGKGIPGRITDFFSNPGLLSFFGGMLGIGLWNGGKGLWRKGWESWAKGGGSRTTSRVSSPTENVSGPTAPSKPTRPGLGRGRSFAAKSRLANAKLGKWGTAGKIGGSALAIGYGAYQIYSGVQEAGENYRSNLEFANQQGIGAYEKEQRIALANSQHARETGKAIGEGIGTIGGGIAGMKIGAAIGTAIAPGIGTAIGGFVGGVAGGIVGSKYGGKIGKGLASEDEKSDDLNREIEAVEKGDEEDNFKKIVLPVESIDYNVALIAQRLGVKNTGGARNNVYAKVLGPIEAATFQEVNPTPEGRNEASRAVNGSVNLNVHGSVELKMNGASLGGIKPSEITKMIQNDPSIKRAIVNLILESNARAGINKKVGDNSNNQQGVLNQNRR